MKRSYGLLSALLASVLSGPVDVHAQEAETLDEVKEAFKKDKTGTNPMNFTHDLRVYDEYRWLEVNPPDSLLRVGHVRRKSPLLLDEKVGELFLSPGFRFHF